VFVFASIISSPSYHVLELPVLVAAGKNLLGRLTGEMAQICRCRKLSANLTGEMGLGTARGTGVSPALQPKVDLKQQANGATSVLLLHECLQCCPSD